VNRLGMRTDMYTDDPAAPEPASAAVLPRRRVTSADVATAAGVSRATVSYVLNDVPGKGISEATRRLVIETAQRLGHVPSAAGRALRSGQSRIVLALVPGFEIGLLFDRVLAILNQRLSRRGYALLVHSRSEHEKPLADLWGFVSPTLVVAMGGLDSSELGVVQHVRLPIIDVAALASFSDIGRMQAARLIDGGHRRLAYIRPEDPNLQVFAEERLEGVLDECAQRGLEPPLVAELGVEVADARVFVERWAAMPDRPTGICAYNDDVALSLWVALAQSGFTPGEDVALIGVDDVPLAGIGLTTVGVDIEAFGAYVGDSIEGALDGQPPAPQPPDFISLIERVSA
jgi:DNA-binding LacI/PurR family transcriptional regulator